MWLLPKFYYLIYIFSMKNDLCMCNISMEQNICRLQGDIKMTRLQYLINHITNLCDPWLWTLEHNSFQTCFKLSKVKRLTTIYAPFQLISEYNYIYIFVKIERSKISEFSNFHERISTSSKEKMSLLILNTVKFFKSTET